MKLLLPLIAAALMAISAYAGGPGWTLDDCVDHWGSPVYYTVALTKISFLGINDSF
jgi:hypothetical protein